MKYHGLSHLPIPRFLYGLWKWIFCRHNIHLLDEVLSCTGGKNEDGGWNHYLVCDACQLMVKIWDVDETYVNLSVPEHTS
jgi:hypothetical protein